MSKTDITHRLPPVIAAYVKASNAADTAAFLGVFTDDALVNDVQREFWGKAAIGKWAEHEIFGAKVTMAVVHAVERHGDVIVTAKLDGEYDKTGLPDPLLLTSYFTLRGGKIVTLIILHNKPAQPEEIR
jgi:ketosteroid isomerase-like protein